MTSRCTFCNQMIERGRISAHYRYKHKHNDGIFASHCTSNEHIQNVSIPVREKVSETLVDRGHTTSSSNSRPLSPETSQCIICLEDHHDTVLPCNHGDSCGPCLNRWWQESFHAPRCPMCRTETESVNRRGQRTDIVEQWFGWRQSLLHRRGDDRMPSIM